MARAFHVGMRQFVHQQHGRTAGQRGIEVELRQRVATVRHLAQRQPRQPGQQIGGFGPAVRLDDADHDIGPDLVFALRGVQHRVGFADAGAGAEVDAQPATGGTRRPFAELLKKLVRVGARGGEIHSQRARRNRHHSREQHTKMVPSATG